MLWINKECDPCSLPGFTTTMICKKKKKEEEEEEEEEEGEEEEELRRQALPMLHVKNDLKESCRQATP
jgi:hypothetical protein